MSKFIALPVGEGDSFYLERENIRILVDGGSNPTNISNLLSHHTSTNHLDVVICTHNDADHAKGIIGLLENWTGNIKEVWVPAKWSYKLQQLFDDPLNFVEELAREVVDLPPEYETLSDININELQIEHDNANEENVFNLESILDENTLNIDISELRVHNEYLFWRYFRFDSAHLSLFIDAIEAADRIKKIIDIAYRQRGCNLRFFEFGPQVSGGIKDVLEPVNSKEILKLCTHTISILQYLALSTNNEESLVFIAKETDDNPAVLFTADSDLNFSLSNIGSINNPPIITTPHHGSYKNYNAYIAINNQLTNIHPIWVRSDCKSKTRPCADYKKQQLRECTLCNTNLNQKKAVFIHSIKNKWKFSKNKCTCL